MSKKRQSYVIEKYRHAHSNRARNRHPYWDASFLVPYFRLMNRVRRSLVDPLLFTMVEKPLIGALERLPTLTHRWMKRHSGHMNVLYVINLSLRSMIGNTLLSNTLTMRTLGKRSLLTKRRHTSLRTPRKTLARCPSSVRPRASYTARPLPKLNPWQNRKANRAPIVWSFLLLNRHYREQIRYNSHSLHPISRIRIGKRQRSQVMVIMTP